MCKQTQKNQVFVFHEKITDLAMILEVSNQTRIFKNRNC